MLTVHAILLVSNIVTLFPFIYVVSNSISDPINVVQQRVWLFPEGFSLEAYGMVFKNKSIWISYGNTLWYAVVGTLLNLIMTVITAYPLSVREFSGRKVFTLFMVFTMFFAGGIIPSFILVNKLGLYNTRWAIVIPAAISTWNVIITRSYFMQTIPVSLMDAAKIDGCTDIGILFRTVLPLSKPIIAVIALYSAVGFWNSYFSALLYLPSPKYQPLQLFLMKILTQNSEELQASATGFKRQLYAAQLKYAAIIVSILPVIFTYPFLQKYFIKGMTLGAVKE